MKCIKVMKTNIKKSNIKILQNTEALFEKLCYLTKLSLKAGEGTAISIDITDLANCIGVSKRTIRNHLNILRKLGMICRTNKHWHVYELNNLVLVDLVQKKRHKFLISYLNAKPVDNLLFFPPNVEKNSPPHIYMTKNKSNKSQGRIFSKKIEKEGRPKRTTVQDMCAVVEEVLEKNYNLDKRLCRLLVAAMKLKFKTLENFREYCELIRKSWIWFSVRIKSLIHYILKFSVIDAFMPKVVSYSIKFGVNAVVDPEKEAAKEFDRALDHIDNLEEDEGCKYVRRTILQRHGGMVYETWMTKVTLARENGKVVIKEGNSSFVADYVEQNLFMCLR